MNRITSEWTSDLISAFGNNSQINRAISGENLWEAFAHRTYDLVINHSSDKEKQIQGIDFTIKKNHWRIDVTVDVKSNLRDGYFFIENDSSGWLRHPNKKTIRIVHVDPDTGWICEYDRKVMIKYLDSKNEPKELIRLSVFDLGLATIIRRYNILPRK